MFTCEACNKKSSVTLAPCPDKRPGCLIAHHDSNSYVCSHCSHDNWKWIADANLKAIHHMKIGVGVANVKALEKLELFK